MKSQKRSPVYRQAREKGERIMVRDARNQQLRDTVTTTYSVTPAVRHDAYHPTADDDDAAVTSSRLAVRTVRVIIGEKFLDFFWGGAKFEKGFRYVTVFGFAYNYSLQVWWRLIQKWRRNKLLVWATLCISLTVAAFYM